MAAKDFIWGSRHSEQEPNKYKWHSPALRNNTMNVIMEDWRKFTLNESMNVGLSAKSDKDKEMLIGLARSTEDNIRDWGDMLILSFNSEEEAANFTSNPQVSVFNPQNIPQENLDAVESGASEMGIDPGEGDIRHTRADGQKYRSKMGSGDEEDPSVEFDFGGDRGIELVTPSRAKFLNKMRKHSQDIHKIQTQQDARAVYRGKYGTKPDNPRITEPEGERLTGKEDTISTPPPSMSKRRRTEPYTLT